jgi:DNA processing protein
MEITKFIKGSSEYPKRLLSAKSPPRQIYCQGTPLNDLLGMPTAAIVGSRSVSAYGRQVTYDLARQLSDLGFVIISGLAIGVDAEAHQAALLAGGPTIAVLPTGLTRISPTENIPLAREILAAGGTLVSESDGTDEVFKTHFVARNRIVTALADVLIITEAQEMSGTIRSAKFAHDQGRPVMVVPGPIYSPTSRGANNLLKKPNNVAVTCAADVLALLQIRRRKTKTRDIGSRNPLERLLLSLMKSGVSASHELLEASEMSVADFSITLTKLEIAGKIRPLGVGNWGIL